MIFPKILTMEIRWHTSPDRPQENRQSIRGPYSEVSPESSNPHKQGIRVPELSSLALEDDCRT